MTVAVPSSHGREDWMSVFEQSTAHSAWQGVDVQLALAFILE